MKPILVFDWPGVYVPKIVGASVNWYRDTTGDPLVGVYVPNIKNATLFATVIRQVAMEFTEEAR